MTPLTSVQPRDRSTIVRRMTRYEILCTIDGTTTTIGFTGRPSKHSLLDAARHQQAAILPYLTDSDTCHYRRGRLVLGTRVILSVGQTERQSQE